MIVSKYCDVVLEPSFFQAGLNFYERGANIATANLLTTVMPVFLNPTTWSEFLSLFVRTVRKQSEQLFNEWKRSAELIFAFLENAHPDCSAFFAPVMLMRNSSQLFDHVGKDELAAAYHVLAGYWGKTLRQRYLVIGDKSKVLVSARPRLLKLSDPTLKPISAGTDRRRMEFPLKVHDIIAEDSKTYRQLQLADVIAGAIASAAKAKVTGRSAFDEFDEKVSTAVPIKRSHHPHDMALR